MLCKDFSRFLFLGVLCMSSCYANCTKSFGSLHCGADTEENISFSGNVTLDGTTVTNNLDVNGQLHAISANISKANISGNSDFSQAVISKKCNITGYLKADKSNFIADIVANTNKLELNKTKTNNIVVKSNNGEKAIVMLNNSTVQGDISFSSGNGEVINNNSTIKGRVSGGVVTKKGV